MAEAPRPQHVARSGGDNAYEFRGLLGYIDPGRLVRILAEYTAAWMNGAFVGEMDGPLLRGPEEDGGFPEVEIVMSSGF